MKVELIKYAGDDLMIVNSARVSLGKEKKEIDKSDIKLIKYLIANKHVSTLEHCFFTFRLEIPIYIARQLMRHRSWCLSGDNKLWFSQPNGTRRFMTVKEFHDKFQNGAKPIKRGKAKTLELISMPLKDRLSKMNINFYNTKTGKIENTNITDIWSNGIKDVWEMFLSNGKKIKATLDHKFFTNKGWLTLNEIKESINDVEVFSVDNISSKKQDSEIELDFSKEQWVDFYKDSNYSISSLGRVKSERSGKIKKITFREKDNKAVFSYSKDGKTKTEVLSQAVYYSFNKKDKDLGKFVLHSNDNQADNRLENLRLGTARENASDMYKNGGIRYNTVHPVKVVSIELVGQEEVYDLSVAHDEHSFICEGIVTHNCFNEISGRYVEFEESFFTPDSFRLQDKDIKQGSKDDTENVLNQEYIQTIYDSACKRSFEEYKRLLELGVCKEQARGILPLSLNTQLYATCNLRSLFHYLELRLHHHAQKEIQDISKQMLELVRNIEGEPFKYSIEAFGFSNDSTN